MELRIDISGLNIPAKIEEKIRDFHQDLQQHEVQRGELDRARAAKLYDGTEPDRAALVERRERIEALTLSLGQALVRLIQRRAGLLGDLQAVAAKAVVDAEKAAEEIRRKTAAALHDGGFHTEGLMKQNPNLPLQVAERRVEYQVKTSPAVRDAQNKVAAAKAIADQVNQAIRETDHAEQQATAELEQVASSI